MKDLVNNNPNFYGFLKTNRLPNEDLMNTN